MTLLLWLAHTPGSAQTQPAGTGTSQPVGTGGAQSQSGDAYDKGKSYIDLGLGLGSEYGASIALGGSYEYGFSSRISGGVYAYYEHFNEGYVGYNYGYSFFYFGVRASYHFAKDLKINNNKIDLYGGVGLGYATVNQSAPEAAAGYPADPRYGSKINPDIFAGGKYYFAHRISAFAELGYGVSILRAGIGFKL
jgi:hypothetical protein